MWQVKGSEHVKCVNNEESVKLMINLKWKKLTKAKKIEPVEANELTEVYSTGKVLRGLGRVI